MGIALCALFAGRINAAPACCAVKTEAEAYSSESIFHFNSIWTNQAGETVHIHSMKGDWHVAGMFFSHCSSICPRLVHDMKLIREALPVLAKEKTEFLLVSLDPERDTPERLIEFQGEMEIADGGWTLWQGYPSDVRALAAAFGVAYRKLPDGDFSHSAVILLINPDGEIVMRLQDFASDRKPMIERIIAETTQP